MHFRNPILVKTMVKVFWQFPSPYQEEKWKRLTPNVQQQANFLKNPRPLFDKSEANPVYTKETSNFKDTELTKEQVEKANQLYEFALEYKRMNKVDLNYMLTNWVDLKYDHIWSDEFISQKKQEIKDNSTYYRIVKQGSQLVYVAFHIFTILIVMLMATMRQSLISLGYVLIIFPRMKDGSEVLSQRTINQSSSKDKLEEEIQELEDQLKAAQGEDSKLTLEDISKIEDELFERKQLLKSYLDSQKKMSFKQKQEMKKQ